MQSEILAKPLRIILMPPTLDDMLEILMHKQMGEMSNETNFIVGTPIGDTPLAMKTASEARRAELAVKHARERQELIDNYSRQK